MEDRSGDRPQEAGSVDPKGVSAKFVFGKAPDGWRGFSKGSWHPAMRGTLELPGRFLHMHEPLDGRPEEEIKKVLTRRLMEALARDLQKVKVSLKKKEQKVGEPPRKPS